MANKQIQKNSALGGDIRKVTTTNPITGKKMKVNLEPMRDYSPEAIKKDLVKYNLEAIKDVEIEDPITGKKSIVTIDRTGTHDNKLITALANPNLNRDQKDSVLSMYLFERGKENASMMVDLYRYKGAHTKETRAFTSQMRFDFEMFITIFIGQMRSIARDIASEYNIGDIKDFCDKWLEEVREAKENNAEPYFYKFLEKDYQSNADISLIKMMVRNWTEADAFEERVHKITESREQGKGKGIYIDANGKPYSIYEDNKVDEVVKADIERISKLNEETNE